MTGTRSIGGTDYEEHGAVHVGGAADIAGDLSAPGGFRKDIGPWVQTNVGASQTDARLGIGASGTVHLDLVMPRAGSVMGIMASLTVAPAGSNPIVKVFKNGSALDAACILTVAAGSDLDQVALFAKDLYAFAAGDRIGLAITTDGSWSATSSDITVTLEVEC